MAVKTFCDLCNIEVKQGDEVASVTSVEKQHVLYLQKSKKAPQERIMSITRIVCGKCFIPIKKIFDDAKK